ncbi:uncharacterized protein LOC110859166 isoform X2 [Folsomia candida]|uniref:uncharacterized protein LOC110859166 isoform X2 n=1 Tax=Folsomia candida TaxID=158441 RepID=UPI00160524BB|nr:uncharacterized protein LOC110859166 isoform X2 [Folsomia candida]
MINHTGLNTENDFELRNSGERYSCAPSDQIEFNSLVMVRSLLIFLATIRHVIVSQNAGNTCLVGIAELMTREMDVPAGPAKKITDTFLRRFRRCPENIRVPLDEWRCTLWSEALGDDYEELAEDIYPRWKKLRYRNLVLSEANANMLRQLHKEYQLAIVTNGPSNSQWEKIREMKLQQYFDVIVVSGDLKWEKPQPEIFLRACQMLGVEPFECLMIGDKLETDIAGGFQAQLGITVWVPNSDDEGRTAPLNPPPDFTIPDVSELVQILQGGKDKNKAGKNVRAKKTSTSSGATTSATPSTSEGLPNGTTTTSNSRVAPAVASTSAAAAASTASANKTSTAQADED